MAIELKELNVQVDGNRPVNIEKLVLLAEVLKEINEGDLKKPSSWFERQDLRRTWAPEIRRNAISKTTFKHVVLTKHYPWGWIEISLDSTTWDNCGVYVPSYSAKAVFSEPE